MTSTQITGDRIRQARERSLISQEELAEILLVSVTTVANWERERFFPNQWETRRRLVAWLEQAEGDIP